MGDYSFKSIVWKTTLVHTVTYFLTGLLALYFLDYTARFADPQVATYMRQTDTPWVAAGPLFQVVRGLLFGWAFFLLRQVVFARKSGWLIMWLVLVMIGILSPFGAAPGSIEGAVYTNLPIMTHVIGLPEVLLQALLLAVFTHLWVNHPQWKWMGWIFGLLFTLVVLFSILGVLASMGILEVPEAFTL
jgi:hypothetical protein